jgi:hypothetical protein
LQYVAQQAPGQGWERFGRYYGEPEDSPEHITFSHDGHRAVYRLYPHQDVNDLARWFAAAVGGMTMMYPVKIADRLYEVTDTLGEPPAELLDDDREDDLEAWYDRREAELLTGVA